MSLETDKEELRVITIEELRQFDGFENVSDEKATEIIETVKELALITYSITTNNEQSPSIPKLRKAE